MSRAARARPLRAPAEAPLRPVAVAVPLRPAVDRLRAAEHLPRPVRLHREAAAKPQVAPHLTLAQAVAGMPQAGRQTGETPPLDHPAGDLRLAERATAGLAVRARLRPGRPRTAL